MVKTCDLSVNNGDFTIYHGGKSCFNLWNGDFTMKHADFTNLISIDKIVYERTLNGDISG